jgi:hypothetical protein
MTYDKIIQIGEKIADANYNGFIDYEIAMGLDGMGVHTNWSSESTAKAVCENHFQGKFKTVLPTYSYGEHSYWQAYVDGIEVLFVGPR